MIVSPTVSHRSLVTETIHADLVIVGGGLAGTCCAISAARQGLSTVLVQDRPVLGGNASSEVRLWVLGATSHLGNNNRWSREGAVMNEIMEENLYRNRQGNAMIYDTILLEKCMAEPKLRLLLNTAAHEVEKLDDDTIAAVMAFCPQNSTRYELRAPYFCDASGDGIVGFLSGAPFRMGAETKEEFGEQFAPDEAYGQMLGHSMYFYSKDVGVPVKYKAPSWALKDITKIPRYRQFNTNMQGCNFWWLEYGGRLDTIHQTEEIKWELWKVIYGVWDYFKNSGNFPEAETMQLEWVGTIPGKRESRRFEGDYMIRQQDIVEQTAFTDVVAHGGWAVDLHPADGLYSSMPGCTQWHSKGVYGIPLRCYYSRSIKNLFLAGRIISATHVAFGSTRVMATCGAGGQAVAAAVKLCLETSSSPRDLLRSDLLAELQCRLQRMGQYLPGVVAEDPKDLATSAQITASSNLQLSGLAPCDSWQCLDASWAMLLPLAAGPCPRFSFEVEASGDTVLQAQLRRSLKSQNFTPEVIIETIRCEIPQGRSVISIAFEHMVPEELYHFITLCENPLVRVRLSEQRVSGIVSVSTDFNKAVARSGVQSPPDGIGIDTFEFWLPKRRPAGQNLAFTCEPALELSRAQSVACGPARPTSATNAWIASLDDTAPEVSLEWASAVAIRRIIIEADPDWDHPMESVLMTHPEEVCPFMIREFVVIDDQGQIVSSHHEHHSAHTEIILPQELTTRTLTVRVTSTHGAPAALYRIRVYSSTL